MDLTLPLEAEALIPHRLPMRLVDRLLSVEGGNGVVEARVAADCPLVSSAGELENLALTELMAQAYAAVKGYSDQVAGASVKQGFLVGIKKMVVLLAAEVGDILKVNIKPLAVLDGVSIADGEVWRGTELIARGEIKVWVH